MMQQYQTHYDYVHWDTDKDYIGAVIEGVDIDFPKYNKKRLANILEYVKSLENPPRNFSITASTPEELVTRIDYWCARGYSVVDMESETLTAELAYDY